jgi:dipeptidyl aminopeptidase/acylaminoacyl peptidase
MMFKKITISILVIMTFAYVGSAWFFSSKILQLGLSDCDVEHFVFCGDPSTQNIPFEDVSFTTIDGLTIPAWYMPVDNAEHAILLVHGRTASRHEGMRYAKVMVNAGYSVLAIDLRHPRQDPNIISTMGYHEKKDAVAALDYLETVKGFNSIGVMGFSMGAAISMTVMAKDARIKAGVFSGGYANSMDVLSEQAAIIYGLPRYPLMPLVELIFEWRGDLDSDEINPEKYIAQISPRPIYIMHGTADTTVGFHHGERLFAAAKHPKQFWQATGGLHTRLWQLDQAKAENSVIAFFDQYLQQ